MTTTPTISYIFVVVVVTTRDVHYSIHFNFPSLRSSHQQRSPSFGPSTKKSERSVFFDRATVDIKKVEQKDSQLNCDEGQLLPEEKKEDFQQKFVPIRSSRWDLIEQKAHTGKQLLLIGLI